MQSDGEVVKAFLPFSMMFFSKLFSIKNKLFRAIYVSFITSKFMQQPQPETGFTVSLTEEHYNISRIPAIDSRVPFTL